MAQEKSVYQQRAELRAAKQAAKVKGSSSKAPAKSGTTRKSK